tara:strand:+ start:45 stop:1151 length:1107 start_codon:yes stop_codon:yes gene_type:complete
MNLLDLFSGIGGFHLGLEQAGYKFDWVGYSDIDNYANKQYKRRFDDAEQLGDVTAIQCEDLPKNIDLLCGGFPCQAFSIAGLRKGFDDTRGTLFFEIARILRYYKERGNPINNFILENVKGLLSHEDGRTFATIYGVLADLGYTVECQLLNTRWFLPQNRERIYIVGHFRGECRPKVFPIGKTEGKNRTCAEGGITGAVKQGWGQIQNDATYLKQVGTIGKDSEATRVYDPSGVSRTIKNGGGMGAKTGLYDVKGIEKVEPKYSQKSINETLEKENLGKEDIKALDLYNRKAQDISPALTEPHHNSLRLYEKSKIRRLTPTECERLQGFPDGWTEGQSDTQRYKQLGNAVSVPVVKAIGEKLKKYIHI